MDVVLFILIVILFVFLIIFITGLILLEERIVSRQSVFDVSPEILYKIVTDNSDWNYRSDLKDIRIIERQGDIEVWEEVAKNGNVVRFKTMDKSPYTFYSFDMESKVFSGYWTAEFKTTSEGKTLFIATEYIRVRNPFLRTLSYLFFNVGKFMEDYQRDLNNKLIDAAKHT